MEFETFLKIGHFDTLKQLGVWYGAPRVLHTKRQDP